jgi:hypothetical protein
MKNTKTPRTMADCSFVQGYASIKPMATREPIWERLAGYVLAFAIGCALAGLLVVGWSS